MHSRRGKGALRPAGAHRRENREMGAPARDAVSLLPIALVSPRPGVSRETERLT